MKHVLGVLLLTLALPIQRCCAACTQTLNPGANLTSAVSSAASGSTLCLANGNYGALNLNDISKTSYVTLQSVNPKGATLGYTQIGNSDFLRIQDVVIAGGIINSCSQHIQIKNSQFTSGMLLRNDSGCTPTTNLDITLDGNTYMGLGTALWEGRLSIGLTGNPSGIVITNNTFGGGGCSDGIQLVGDVGGVQIGPGNVFRDLLQGSCGEHVDAIQTYGAGPGTKIEGNYFINNTVHIGIYDGGSNYTIRNNVFDRPNDTHHQAIQMGGINTVLMEHNTFRETTLGIGTKFANTPHTNWIVQNNIFDDSDFTAAGDQPGCGANCILRYNLKSRGGSSTPAGTNSMTGDAAYVGAGTPGNWAGWQLAAGSPGKTAGNDGLDIGTNFYGSTTPPPPPPPSGSVCDINKDGSPTVADVQLCANQAIHVTACTTGDINLDGSCTVVDVQRVVNAALGGPCVTP